MYDLYCIIIYNYIIYTYCEIENYEIRDLLVIKCIHIVYIYILKLRREERA